MNFPKAQNGSFTGHEQNVRWASVRALVNNQFIDTTGVSPSGVADQINRYCEAFDIVRLVARGTVTNSAGTACSKAQQGWMALGRMQIKPLQWSFARRWQLEDVTGTTYGVPDPDKEYDRQGFPLITGQVQGLLMADGLPLDVKDQTLNMDVDLIGAFQGGSIVRQGQFDVRFGRGGVIPASFALQFTEGYEFTPATVSQWPVFEETQSDLLFADLDLDTDTGEQIQRRAVLESIQISNPAKRGGPIGVAAVWRLVADLPSGTPADPTSVVLTSPSAGMAQVAWAHADAANVGVIIRRKPNGSGSFEQVGLTNGAASPFKDYGVTPGVAYDYDVQAINRAGTTSAQVASTPTNITIASS